MASEPRVKRSTPIDGNLASPLRLSPDNFTANVWGGDWIPRFKSMPARPGPVGEAWEFSTHRDRPSRVLVGRDWVSLRDLIRAHPTEILGESAPSGEAPFLLKLIDSRDDLSLQVHPDDAAARRLARDTGKSESWYVLETGAEEGDGVLYLGFRPEKAAGYADPESFAEAFLTALRQANSAGPTRDPETRRKSERLVLPFLNRISVKVGDAFNVPPGTIHAVGRGVRLVEIQETSDITYRVWDWNRPDPTVLEGSAFRPLHIKEATEVLDFTAQPADRYRFDPVKEAAESGVECATVVEERERRFSIRRVRLQAGASHRIDVERFGVLTAIAQPLSLTQAGRAWGTVERGHSVLLPAALRGADLRATGATEFLVSHVP